MQTDLEFEVWKQDYKKKHDSWFVNGSGKKVTMIKLQSTTTATEVASSSVRAQGKVTSRPKVYF